MMILVIRVRLSVLWFMGIWLALQASMAYLDYGSTAWFAHIGGFAGGLVYALTMKSRVKQMISPTRFS